MKKINLSAKLAGIFASFSLLIVGTIILVREMSIEYESVMYAAKLSVISSIFLGALGYMIGKLLDTSLTKGMVNKVNESYKDIKDPELLIDDLLIDDVSENEIK